MFLGELFDRLEVKAEEVTILSLYLQVSLPDVVDGLTIIPLLLHHIDNGRFLHHFEDIANRKPELLHLREGINIVHINPTVGSLEVLQVKVILVIGLAEVVLNLEFCLLEKSVLPLFFGVYMFHIGLLLRVLVEFGLRLEEHFVEK